LTNAYFDIETDAQRPVAITVFRAYDQAITDLQAQLDSAEAIEAEYQEEVIKQL